MARHAGRSPGAAAGDRREHLGGDVLVGRAESVSPKISSALRPQPTQ
jgi:hypothetical protein